MKFIGDPQELKLFQQHSIYSEVPPPQQENSKVRFIRKLVFYFIYKKKKKVIPF